MPRPSYKTKKSILAVLDFIVVFGVIVIIFLLLTLMGKVNKQVNDTHNDVQTSTATIEGDLKCLEQFFTLDNRANLTIKDLGTCTIVDSTTGQSFVPKN